MTVLVFGKTGQVAQALAALSPEACFLGRDEADLSLSPDFAAILRRHAASAVINAAAYTAVDRAEAEEPLAAQINAAAPGAMVAACRDLGIPFVHVSTDYVFDGQGQAAFAPADPAAPINAYGRTKRAGEQAVIAAGGCHAILRTSWVFSAQGANFVKTMLRLGKERESLSVVADQVGGPTPAKAIAAACLRILGLLQENPGLRGIYHFSGAPDTTWADFAREIMAQAGLPCRITDIPSSAYPTPAQRPANSRLDCTSLHTAFGIDRPDWRAGLQDVLKELEFTK